MLKVCALGDTKRPPRLRPFKSPNSYAPDKANFSYDIKNYERGNKHFHVLMQVDKNDFHISISWSSRSMAWDILISSNENPSLGYEGKYYKFKHEIKNLIDFVCDLAKHEFKKQRYSDALALASKEVRLFKKMEMKLKEIETDFYSIEKIELG